MVKSQHMSNAQKLLLEYRPAIWRKTLLEAVPGIGNKAMQACMEQMHFTQELVQSLRNHKLLGEKLYWIVYALYMTDQQPNDIEEILSEIAAKYKAIPRRTYFRLKGRAIKMLDEHLVDMANKKWLHNLDA